MSTLIIAVLSFVGFIAAYHTYGKWLAGKIFGLDPDQKVPSQELRDDVDYVPTKKEVIFGHHFTSIAGTGPHRWTGDCSLLGMASRLALGGARINLHRSRARLWSTGCVPPQSWTDSR